MKDIGKHFIYEYIPTRYNFSKKYMSLVCFTRLMLYDHAIPSPIDIIVLK
jgi:hypothetical protein